MRVLISAKIPHAFLASRSRSQGTASALAGASGPRTIPTASASRSDSPGADPRSRYPGAALLSRRPRPSLATAENGLCVIYAR
jgi:hypothetical protein